MRPAVYTLSDRPWWEDACGAAVGAFCFGVVLLVALFLAGCGDNVECPPDVVPPVCVPASGATTDLCGYSVTIAGTDYPVAGCAGFVQNDGCTVPELLAKADARGRSLVDVLCVSQCEAGR